MPNCVVFKNLVQNVAIGNLATNCETFSLRHGVEINFNLKEIFSVILLQHIIVKLFVCVSRSFVTRLEFSRNPSIFPALEPGIFLKYSRILRRTFLNFWLILNSLF